MSEGRPRNYDISLGPLAMVAMSDKVGEAIGDGLEVAQLR